MILRLLLLFIFKKNQLSQDYANFKVSNHEYLFQRQINYITYSLKVQSLKQLKMRGTLPNTTSNKTKKFDESLKGKMSDDNMRISQLNIQNNKSSYLGQTTLPKKGHQTDNYQGPVDPQTRLRNGIGTYRYPNKFFTFTGNYKQGVKQGQGTLKMADGTIIKGHFENNQLNGEAQINYSDGSTYKGRLSNGQKSGYGIYKSRLQSYQGEYLQNMRHGQGTYKNSTTTISGNFQNNKPHGSDVVIKKYNYQYKGECANGFKNGKGVQTSTYLDENYHYEGEFNEDKFQGHGIYDNKSAIGYRYQGSFKQGKPALYPNEFRISMALTTGPQAAKPPIENFNVINSQQALGTPIQIQLQSENRLYFLIESCYQGPQTLDPNQPTEQQIQKMTKDWQNENKKNKNPPPMPDFRQPRKIKPALVLVTQQSERPIEVRLAKLQGNETGTFIKVDYRDEIKKKREENQIAKAEATKKAQQQGNKKGGKPPNKGGQIELKVNCYIDNPPEKQKLIRIKNNEGEAELQKIQFPDDFPPGTYQIVFSSPFQHFGGIKEVKKTINIKQKNVGGKKK